MATLQEIADMAGVAKSTVSRALRDDPTLAINDTTREKIFSAAEELNYKVKKEKLLSPGCRIAIVHKNTHFINQIDNAYYFAIRSGIEEICHLNNIQYSFVPLEYLNQLPAGLDGMIVVGNFMSEQIKVIAASIKKRPVVFMGPGNYLPGEADWVTYDIGESVRTALQYLKDNGLLNLLYIGGYDVVGTSSVFRKLEYFKSFIAEHSEMKALDILEGEYGAESGYVMMKQWLKENDYYPDAIFASNDPIAIGVLRALNEGGIPVPERISVISVNGDSPGEFVTPALTTVDVHSSNMGREAVIMLKEQMDQRRTAYKKVMYDVYLVERGSVKISKQVDKNKI